VDQKGATSDYKGAHQLEPQRVEASSLRDLSADFYAIHRQPSGAGDFYPVAVLLHRALEEYLFGRAFESDSKSDRAISPPRSFRMDPKKPRKNVTEIVHDLLRAKKEDGLSLRYIETIRSHLTRFAAAFELDIASITAPQIEQWLREQKIGPRARNNIRASVLTLFHYARKLGYLQKGGPTEADEVAKAKEWGGKIGIVKPEELIRILAAGPPQQVQLFLVLGAFTGMRSSEILRLEWRDLNLERDFITVAPEKAKTATRRLVPVLPNLKTWLTSYRGANGFLFHSRRDVDRVIAFAKGQAVEWPNNALRHSYATYRLAITANAARVALEMGTSPQKLMRNYRELADRREALRWFSISPSTRPKPP
jgi:integrase